MACRMGQDSSPRSPPEPSPWFICRASTKGASAAVPPTPRRAPRWSPMLPWTTTARERAFHQPIWQPALGAWNRPFARKTPSHGRSLAPRQSPYTPPQFCHSPARRWRRYSQRAGITWPQEPCYHADLHACNHYKTPGCVRKSTPSGTLANPIGLPP